MNDLLNKYDITGELFDYFRITKTKAKEFLDELIEENWSKEQISNVFALFEIHYKNRKYPIYWKNSIKHYLKNQITEK